MSIFKKINFLDPIKVKKILPTAKLPERGSESAAGYDIFACLNHTITIKPHETVKIGTGLTIEAPNYCWYGIVARSGIATKEGLRPANCVGVIDPDYRGEIIVALHNDSEIPREVYNGEKIAQMIFFPRIEVNFEEVDELNETERGDGGFGSTGK